MLTSEQKAKRTNLGQGYSETDGQPHFAGEDFEISLFGPSNYLHGYGRAPRGFRSQAPPVGFVLG